MKRKRKTKKRLFIPLERIKQAAKIIGCTAKELERVLARQLT